MQIDNFQQQSCSFINLEDKCEKVSKLMHFSMISVHPRMHVKPSE